MNKRLDLPHWVTVICMVFLTFSLLHGYFSITARGWIWIPLACFMSLLLSTAVIRTRQFVCLVFYYIILAINLISGKSSNTDNFIVLNFATLFWALSFPFILKDDANVKFVKVFVYAETFVVILTSLLTIIINLRMPGVVRQAVTYVNAGRSDMALALYRLGVCEYGLPHAIPIIIPAIVKLARNRKVSLLQRLFASLLVLLLSYFVLISEVTTAILLLFFAIVGSFLINSASRKKTYARLAILSIIALPFMSQDVVLSSLSKIAEFVPVENSFHGKLVSIENTIKYDEAEGSVESREDKYSMSWNSFLEDPVMGGSGTVITGGHSTILDTFGAYGLLGGIPFLLLLFFHLKSVHKLVPEETKSFFFVGAIIT